MVRFKPLSKFIKGFHFNNFFAFEIFAYNFMFSKFLNLIFPNFALPNPIFLTITLTTFLILIGFPDAIFIISPQNLLLFKDKKIALTSSSI